MLDEMTKRPQILLIFLEYYKFHKLGNKTESLVRYLID